MNTLALSLAHTNRCNANKEKNFLASSPILLVRAPYSAEMSPSLECGGSDIERSDSLTF